MIPDQYFVDIFSKHALDFSPVVPFDKERDKLLLMDFGEDNDPLDPELVTDTKRFSDYIFEKLHNHQARYGIGGYNIYRNIYSRSKIFGPTLFNEGEHEAGENILPGLPENTFISTLSASAVHLETEPRRLHLGIDIWGKPFTKVLAPLDGVVHSFAFNHNYGDYGATIILVHQLGGLTFHTLYGHLSLASIKNLEEGNRIKKGDVFAEFGIPQENGNWPPHLHFQMINDLQGMRGDYPGVCKVSEKEKYLLNCPNPDLVLQMMSFAMKEMAA